MGSFSPPLYQKFASRTTSPCSIKNSKSNRVNICEEKLGSILPCQKFRSRYMSKLFGENLGSSSPYSIKIRKSNHVKICEGKFWAAFRPTIRHLPLEACQNLLGKCWAAFRPFLSKIHKSHHVKKFWGKIVLSKIHKSNHAKILGKIGSISPCSESKTPKIDISNFFAENWAAFRRAPKKNFHMSIHVVAVNMPTMLSCLDPSSTI